MNTTPILKKSKRAIAISGIALSALVLAACGDEDEPEEVATEVVEEAEDAATEVVEEATEVEEDAETEEAVVASPETGAADVAGATPAAVAGASPVVADATPVVDTDATPVIGADATPGVEGLGDPDAVTEIDGTPAGVSVIASPAASPVATPEA